MVVYGSTAKTGDLIIARLRSCFRNNRHDSRTGSRERNIQAADPDRSQEAQSWAPWRWPAPTVQAGVFPVAPDDERFPRLKPRKDRGIGIVAYQSHRWTDVSAPGLIAATVQLDA